MNCSPCKTAMKNGHRHHYFPSIVSHRCQLHQSSHQQICTLKHSNCSFPQGWSDLCCNSIQGITTIASLSSCFKKKILKVEEVCHELHVLYRIYPTFSNSCEWHCSHISLYFQLSIELLRENLQNLFASSVTYILGMLPISLQSFTADYYFMTITTLINLIQYHKSSC